MPDARSTFLALVVVGLGALLATAAVHDRRLAFTIGVPPSAFVAQLAPGAEACQRPVSVAESFEAVQFKVFTYGHPGARLTVGVRPAEGGSQLARGVLAAGYPDMSRPIVRLGQRVLEGRRVAVCIANRGARKVALYGGPPLAASGSSGELAGRTQPWDLTLVFLRDEPRSDLSLAPAVFERASLFHPGWVRPWLLWLLAGLVLIVLPVLVLLALGTALRRQ